MARQTARNSPVGRNRALNRDLIIRAALRLVERAGLPALSTRKLGLELGVEAMSIYHHFPSKQHLMDALVDHAMASLEMPPAGLPPVERLRRLCYAYRAMAHRFRGLYPLIALHRLNTPTGVRVIEEALALVQGVVGRPDLAARHFRTIGYFLMGAALDETSGYARGPSAAEPVDDAYIALHCPHLAAAARYFQPAEWDATFALGVEAMVKQITAGQA